MKVVIVGGVAGGASAAARLRRLDEHAEIILLERGPYISFANCGLPYYIGGDIPQKSDLTLQTPESFFARFHVDVRVNSEATEIDPEHKTVTVTSQDGTYQESYDKLILSPGAQPIIPPLEGLPHEKVFTLRNIPDTVRIKEFIQKQAPKSAVVIGGGYIGVEMAENLVQAGLQVTIVEMADHVIAPLDIDMACDVHLHLQAKGVNLALGRQVTAIQTIGEHLQFVLDRGTLEADMAVLCVGVKPDTQFCQRAGLLCNQRGSLLVDQHMRTNLEDIYAVGDAVEITNFVTGSKGFLPLAGPANRQGRIAADHICGIPSRYQGTQGSSILKVFDLTVAATGINEKAAKAEGLSFDKMFTYSPSHAGYYPGGSPMSVKVIYEKGTGKILGAQIVGQEGVDKRCDVLAVAIRAGMTAFDLAQLELCYAPPYSSAKDPVNMAGFAIENVLTGKVKTFHWHDVDKLPRDGSVTLLDVRTPSERAMGHIEGFLHIPLDELRSRWQELPQGKPVYIHCHSGLRSYIACRMLSGYGFDCYNLCGGYRLYQSVISGRNIPDHSCLDPK